MFPLIQMQGEIIWELRNMVNTDTDLNHFQKRRPKKMILKINKNI